MLRKEGYAMEKRVIFLDFDGVLRPVIPSFKLRKKERNLGLLLSERYDNPIYQKMDESILHNVYYHFNGEACYCVRMLCHIPHTEIVLSTSWRSFYSLQDMKALLDLHKIGQYVTDVTPQRYHNRASEIQAYLDTHSDITSFVIIDDLDLTSEYPEHMLLCKDHLNLRQYRKGYEILTRKS